MVPQLSALVADNAPSTLVAVLTTLVAVLALTQAVTLIVVGRLQRTVRAASASAQTSAQTSAQISASTAAPDAVRPLEPRDDEEPQSRHTDRTPPPLSPRRDEPAVVDAALAMPAPVMVEFDPDAEYGAPIAPTARVPQQVPYPPQHDLVVGEPAPSLRSSVDSAHPPAIVPTTPPRTPPPIAPRGSVRPSRLPLMAPAGSAAAFPQRRGAVVRQEGFASIEEMAVSAVIDGGRAVPQVAQTMRVSTALVAYWVAKSGRARVR
ncbi:hypothetical protein BH11ACT2_BH11ACT2_05160 [soil metagenome]